MTIYIDCPACPRLRPGFARGLVPKGQKYCRMCAPKIVRRKRKKVA